MVRPCITSPSPEGFSTRKVLMFLYTDAEPVSVFTKTATRFDVPPLVSHIFCPLIVYDDLSALGTAFVVIAATSDPQPGSDIENAPRTAPVAICGSSRCLCSSV